MRRTVVLLLLLAVPAPVSAWDALTVADDPLVRMPGSQPDGSVALEAPTRCLNCHADYDEAVEPGFMWQGSMMAQAARDPIFWASYVVALQDSIWALGNPNAGDLCLRCHFPEGWVEGRSDPTSAADMTDSDYDGVHCDVCHRMVDPFFATADDRESTDWDETDTSDTPSSDLVADTLAADSSEADNFLLYDGDAFYNADDSPVESGWTEAAGGQFFLANDSAKRGPFADNTARHDVLYSRFNKGRYYCNTCHDVSNPALQNIAYAGVAPGDVGGSLPTEQDPVYSYYHVERTFSEFMLSAFGEDGGAAGSGAFAPEVFDTSRTDDWIQTCQDCHMADGVGEGCDKSDALTRPTESEEHPASGVPTHDLMGGNMWVPWLLASTVTTSSNYDSTNAALLGAGPDALTLDLTLGEGLDADALLAAVDRAEVMLQAAATIEDAVYDADTGELSFRVVNHTGHKLPSGYPEGRRMWVNVQATDSSGSLVYELNPYDDAVGTLVGLGEGDSPDLSSDEEYLPELVYEARMSSSFTGEEHGFHFVLADERHKDNRIPPQGFDIDAAPDRMAEPYWEGAAEVDLYNSDEYSGGYDQVDLTIEPGADEVMVTLYYQTTSREFISFLQDEINGTASTLDSPTPSGEAEAYIATTDSFFDALYGWGDTIWELWEHNMTVPGAAPVEMVSEVAENCSATEICNGVDDDCDGLVDEDDPDLVADTWYGDGDEDGFGLSTDTATACDAPEGYVAEGTDCDDSDGAVNPGADEICNEVDDDCDDLVDDDDDSLDSSTATTFYTDGDSDGYGNPASTTAACALPEGYAEDDSDCDDGDGDVNPDATEICNEVDDDCDDLVDDDDDSLDSSTATTWYADSDGDGYGDPDSSTTACGEPDGYASSSDDCDDDNATVYTGAAELCDGLDNDCDDLVDEDTTTVSWYADVDEDGFGDPGDVVESCESVSDRVLVGTDCDDGDAAINPAADEICNEVDDDCDDLVDDEDDSRDTSTATTWFPDEDADEHGSPDDSALGCEAPEGWVDTDDDCDDSDRTIYTGAAELCDELDNDCDELIDEEVEDLPWYADDDGDGWGDSKDVVENCAEVEGRVLEDGDCDDENATIHPEADDTPDDGIDQDCDGEDATSGDGGAADGGAADGGAADGGAADGGASDGAATDGGASDGAATDGGASDGAATDGGASDGGASDEPKDEGCGCTSSGTGGLAALPLLLLVGLVRKRRWAA